MGDDRLGAIVASALVTAAVAEMYRRYSKARLMRAPKEISSRGLASCGPPIPYIGTVIDAFMNPYHPEDNPEGLILMAVAEVSNFGQLSTTSATGLAWFAPTGLTDLAPNEMAVVCAAGG